MSRQRPELLTSRSVGGGGAGKHTRNKEILSSAASIANEKQSRQHEGSRACCGGRWGKMLQKFLQIIWHWKKKTLPCVVLKTWRLVGHRTLGIRGHHIQAGANPARPVPVNFIYVSALFSDGHEYFSLGLSKSPARQCYSAEPHDITHISHV